jgi:hypothetical protein
MSVWESSFSDANGWNQPQYYSTIRIVGGALCGRHEDGIYCAVSNLTDHFVNIELKSSNESDANGWTQPQYYETIQLTQDFKLVWRGAPGIHTGPLFFLSPPDRLSISSVADLNARRLALINKVWNRTTVDTVQGVDEDAPPETIDVQPLPLGVEARRYKINMPTSGDPQIPVVQGIADHYIPAGGSQKLVILNPGHACSYMAFPYQGSETVIELLNAGYAVLATYMPLQTPLQCFTADKHNDLFDPNKDLRPANGAHPLIYFLDPVRRSLNYVLSKPEYNYSQIYMAGLSGGGWTTTLYAALDTRIKTSVPIAGSEPFYMRFPSDAEQEDWPDFGNDFFRFSSGGSLVVTGYKDLYLLGSYGEGRRQIQALNRNDNCCFGQNYFTGEPALWDQAVRAYEIEVRQRLQTLGAGSFRVDINEAEESDFFIHKFSKNTRVAVMGAELDGAVSLLGATNDFFPFGRGMNGRLWRNNGLEGGWSDTGLPMAGTPAIVTGAISGHMFDVFYRDPFNRITHAFFDGASWALTNNLSGRIISDPVAVSWGGGRIDVIALGADYRLYHWKYDGAWRPAQLVHDSAYGVGSLAVTSWGPGRLDIFFRGHDDHLYHIQSNGGPPYTLTDTGDVIKGFPSAVTTGGSLRVYVTSADDQLLQAQQVSDGAWTWSNVSSLSGSTGVKVLGSPSAFLSPSGEITVYARILGSQTDEVGRYVFSGSNWSFSNQGGAPKLGSPIATNLGAFIVDATNQSAWHLTSQGWQSLGGYVDR